MGQGKGLEAGKRGGRSGEAGTEAKGAPTRGPGAEGTLIPLSGLFFFLCVGGSTLCVSHEK